MKLQGSLAELKLPDILQLANMSQETGMIEFRNNEGVIGKVVLQGGEVVHARVADLSGDEAVYEIAIWFDGAFRFVPLDKEYPQNIQGNLTSLLMESARRLDEWRVLSRKIPSFSYYPVISENSNEKKTLNTVEWDIIRYINGSKNIREIAHACGKTPFKTSKLVYGLLINNLVSLSQFPAENKTEKEVPPLVKKLLRIQDETRKWVDDGVFQDIDKMLQDGLARLNADIHDKKAVIETANAVLQTVMLGMGRDVSRDLAVRFKTILKGQTSS
ncbi:MAG: DUF4388 domain-containing protein [Acidobacteria bacterium]|nr:DUF4388 domain-containing protein [Acidobacteriota bacterium]